MHRGRGRSWEGLGRQESVQGFWARGEVRRSWETSLCCPCASPDSGSKGLLQFVPGFLGPQGAGNDGQKPRFPEHQRRGEGWVTKTQSARAGRLGLGRADTCSQCPYRLDPSPGQAPPPKCFSYPKPTLRGKCVRLGVRGGQSNEGGREACQGKGGGKGELWG